MTVDICDSGQRSPARMSKLEFRSVSETLHPICKNISIRYDATYTTREYETKIECDMSSATPTYERHHNNVEWVSNK